MKSEIREGFAAFCDVDKTYYGQNTNGYRGWFKSAEKAILYDKKDDINKVGLINNYRIVKIQILTVVTDE